MVSKNLICIMLAPSFNQFVCLATSKLRNVSNFFVLCKWYIDLSKYLISLEQAYAKNVWCVARHVKNKKILKSWHWLKILCWAFRQLLLPSSGKDKKCKIPTPTATLILNHTTISSINTRSYAPSWIVQRTFLPLRRKHYGKLSE